MLFVKFSRLYPGTYRGEIECLLRGFFGKPFGRTPEKIHAYLKKTLAPFMTKPTAAEIVERLALGSEYMVCPVVVWISRVSPSSLAFYALLRRGAI